MGSRPIRSTSTACRNSWQPEQRPSTRRVRGPTECSGYGCRCAAACFGRCGACKATLPAMAETIEVGSEEFDEVVSDSKVPVLVHFWAAWCGPCRMAAPHVAQIARDLAGRAVVLKVDTERFPELASRYNVQGIPNFPE